MRHLLRDKTGWLAAAVILFHLVYNTVLPIHLDEAYYWWWSQRLELGYFDHPPMIAYLIKLTTLFSDHPFFVRLVPLLATAGSLYYIYRLSERIYGIETARIAALIFLILPTVQISFTVATPDAPLILFFSAGLYYFYLAVTTQKTGYIYLSGLLMGLMLLSKLTGVIFWGAFGLFVLLKKRELLRNIHVYLALLLAVAVNGGFLYWNSQNEWISFMFQYQHGSSEAYRLNPASAVGYVAGFFLIVTPVFAGLFFYLLGKLRGEWRGEGSGFLLFVTAFILLFFGYKALYKPMLLNWYAPALIPLLPFLSYGIVRLALKKTLYIGAAVAVVLALATQFPEGIVPPSQNPKNKFYGYEEALERLRPFIKNESILCSDHQTHTGILHYYLNDLPNRKSNILASKQSMFEIWDKELPRPKTCLAWVERDRINRHHREKCSAITLLDRYKQQRSGLADKTFLIFKCEVRQ